MRLAALFVATLPLTATLSVAQDAPVMSVTQVSYTLPAAALDGPSTRGFPTGANRDVGFAMGSPEGAGFDDQPVKRATPRAAVRVAERRTKKAFSIPWQTGIFQ